MGATLTLALIFISNRLEPLGSPVPTSQIVGVARPYMPEPERSPYAITGTNFAAAYKPGGARGGPPPQPPPRAVRHQAAETKPARRADSLQQQQPAANTEVRRVPRWKHIAQNPIAALMGIH